MQCTIQCRLQCTLPLHSSDLAMFDQIHCTQQCTLLRHCTLHFTLLRHCTCSTMPLHLLSTWGFTPCRHGATPPADMGLHLLPTWGYTFCRHGVTPTQLDASDFVGLKLAIFDHLSYVLVTYKRHIPIYWSIFSPNLASSQGVKNCGKKAEIHPFI